MLYINVERTKKEVVELATKEVCKYFFEKIIENTDNQTEKNNITQGTDKTTDTQYPFSKEVHNRTYALTNE